MSVTFGVFTDLHVDIMHDTQERLECFLEHCRRENVDYIIQLGDFCYPDANRKCVCAPQNRPINIENALRVKTYADKDRIISLFRQFKKPSFHVLGNHDCDMCSKQEILDYYGMTGPSYYSFDLGGWHFVVLDPNYYCLDGQYISFENGNYFDESYRKERILPYLPPEQLHWLEQDLAHTALPTVLFSHQSLAETFPSGILNAAELKHLLKRSSARVIASFNGHNHVDSVTSEDDIWFIGVNSMSNQWLDVAYTCPERYTKEIDEKYPNIKYTVPYRDPVYAIVTLDRDSIHIQGTQSEFVGPSPEELGVYQNVKWFQKKGIRQTAAIEDRCLPICLPK